MTVPKRSLRYLALLFFLVVVPQASWPGMVVHACFSPLGKCSSHIVREIAQAQREILVAVYAFTHDDLAWALAKAQQRGVKVQVVLDQEFDGGNNHSKGSFLEQHGIMVRRVSGLNGEKAEKGAGLMHQKFAVIDRQIVFTGSYNWTVSAETYNDENLLLFRDAGPLAEAYRKEFFRLWEKKR
ncbi:MAG: phospholipase D family protein [Deltaproteobacteria bacterium]|nr:MAG: phospholipase D family protein [Deltaproteobacteria bacterium]